MPGLRVMDFGKTVFIGASDPGRGGEYGGGLV